MRKRLIYHPRMAFKVRQINKIMERIQRLIAIANHIEMNNQLDEITMIDTRYSNGAAVSWKQTLDSLELAESFKRQREQRL